AHGVAGQASGPRPAGAGKTAAAGVIGACLFHDVPRAKRLWSGGSVDAVPVCDAPRSRRGSLCAIPGKELLAGESRGPVSLAAANHMGSCGIAFPPRTHYGRRDMAGRTQAIPAGWLVVVLRHSGAGDWPGAGRSAIDRRPIHLFTHDWAFLRDNLGRSRCRAEPPAMAARSVGPGLGIPDGVRVPGLPAGWILAQQQEPVPAYA